MLADSVQEVYFTLDSVFIGAAERQTIKLQFPGGYPPMFVSELLEWVDRFVRIEGPNLLRDAGKDGLRAALPTVQTLRRLVTAANPRNQQPPNPPPAYHTPRVECSISGRPSAAGDPAVLRRGG